jgi:OOP family OmpA-OmpF porin
MRKPLANKKNRLSVSIGLILGILTAAVNAQTTRYEKEHIQVNIHDSSGKIVRGESGECWHTHSGLAQEGGCNSTPIAKIAKPALKDDTTSMDKTASMNKYVPIPPSIKIEEPVAVRELPIVSTKKIALDASEFFDFGEPILRPSARAQLDDFVEKLMDTNPQTITVIGHADRFGSANYNQILSEQRAATVKAYLVRKGISPDIVITEGKGDTQPITKKDQCPGDKTSQTIECLQPDRRVEIETTGNKTGL